VADPGLHNVLHHLRRAVGAPAATEVTDAQLLDRFVRERDAAAFELLVWRHEHLVRGVCARLLHDRHDAEDAFQAAFLVLLRKARSVGKGASLASWLYKVAYRAALRTRAVAARRRRREARGADLAALPAPPGPAADEALGPLLDEELQALPEKYRTPLVLCYLEGLTYDEAARQLGCPRGTVSTRLTKARELLRRRLARRGVGLPTAALAGAPGAQPALAAPLGLVSATVRAARGAVPARVAAVAEGVLRGMFFARIKSASVVLLLLTFLGTGVGALLHQGRAETAASAAPRADGEQVYRQLFTRTGQDGKPYDREELEPPLAPGSKFLTDGASHKQALAVLDAFLAGSPEKMKPLQRAVLQHDLWAVLATTAGPTRERLLVSARGRIQRTGSYEDEGDGDLARPRQRRALQRRLVGAMRRLALSSREIAALPDNLAAAVKSGVFPKEFEPKRPERPFLPPDLVEADGAWLALANPTAPEGLVAPQHTAFVKGRSVFTVRLRLPGGRKATQAYLQNAARGHVAQFPAGTQIALLRRMLLIDATGRLRPTPLTESVELRYYQKPERGREPVDLGTPAVFVLSRKDLFAGRNGGLRPVGRAEPAPYSFQARVGRMDVDPLELPRPLRQEPLLQSCASCHARKDGRGGVHSVNALHAGAPGEPYGLAGTTDGDQEKATLRWVRKTYTWGLIQGLWARPLSISSWPGEPPPP
jgi:RNA polymerase sigma factor (sigma-70 family)